MGENTERINQLLAELKSAFFALNGKADATEKNLRLLSADVQTNIERIPGELSQMLNWQRELIQWKNEFHSGAFAHSFRTTLE